MSDEFWGLGAIAKRMGVSKNTILAWHDRYMFPFYRRHKGPRVYLYTNEALIARWEGGRCLAERELRRQRKAAPPPQ